MYCTMNNHFGYKQFLLCSRVLLEIGPLNSTKIIDNNAGIIFVVCCLFRNKSFLARNKPIIIHKVYILSEINDDFSSIYIYIYIYIYICTHALIALLCHYTLKPCISY